MQPYLQQLAHSRRAQAPHGIYSVCSAHPCVLAAAMRRHPSSGFGPLLIEATCNQVNQFGGYTGMRPTDFRQAVLDIARSTGFPAENILLGGDHLGPFPWQHLPPEEAMENAAAMVKAYARAGFTKIHLDTSMPCAGDPPVLPDALIAERAARLCAVAEDAAPADALVYVIGTEVPTPGGAAAAMDMPVTTADDAEQALTLHRMAFHAHGLDAAWERVVGLVVQPGVEFGNDTVEDYEPERAQHLTAMLASRPGLMFEAHSTDYQKQTALTELVRGGFCILKVGPALTYAFRQAVYALVAIEQALLPQAEWSRLPERMERAMTEQPSYWQKHYTGAPEQQRLLRLHSYSDRMRYYWLDPSVAEAFHQLTENLERISIPETLLIDSMPMQYVRVRNGEIQKKPLTLISDAIGLALDPYIIACNRGAPGA